MTAETPDMEELPGRMSASFLPFGSMDWCFTVAMLAFAITAWVETNIVGFFIVGAVWFFLMSKNADCRRYEVVPLWFRGLRRNVWVKGDETVSNRAERKRIHRKSERDSSVIPFVVTSVPSNIDGDTIGIMHRKQQHTDSFVVVAEGSDIASVGLSAQEAVYASMVQVVNRLVGSNRGYNVGVSYVFRKDPFDSYALDSELAELLHPEAVQPSALLVPDEEWTDEHHRWLTISENWRQLQEEVLPVYARNVWMATVITVRRTGVLAKAKGTIKTKYVGRLPINRMVRTVLLGLESAGVRGARALNQAEMHSFVRGAWDSETIDEFYAFMDANPEAAAQDGFTEHWPRHQMRRMDGYSNTDGTFTSVLRITGTPKLVLQGYFREFIGMIEVPNFSVALVGEAVRAKWEVAGLERVTAFLEALEDLTGFNRKTLKSQAREERLQKRKREVFESEFSQSFSLLVAINASDQEELDELLEQVTEVAKTLGMDAQRIMPRALQYPAKWSATTGIPML